SNKDDLDIGHAAPRNSATAPNVGLSGTGLASPYFAEVGMSFRLEVTPYVISTNGPLSGSATVTANLTGIGGAASVPLNDAGAGGDEFAGDGVWSTTATVVAAPTGTATIPVVMVDGPKSGGCYVSLLVQAAATPDNDNCSRATLVSGAFPVTTVATLANATVEYNLLQSASATNVPPGSMSSRRGVWYRVVGTGHSMTASTCTSANTDTYLMVFCGTCDSLSQIGYSDDNAAGCPSATAE